MVCHDIIMKVRAYCPATLVFGICNKERKRPSLMDYIATLKHHLIIEKQVYDRKGKSCKFCMLFGQLYANI